MDIDLLEDCNNHIVAVTFFLAVQSLWLTLIKLVFIESFQECSKVHLQ